MRPRTWSRLLSTSKCLLLCYVVIFSDLALLPIGLGSVELPAGGNNVPPSLRLERMEEEVEDSTSADGDTKDDDYGVVLRQTEMNRTTSCATVEEMGAEAAGDARLESLRIRRLIHRHFELHGYKMETLDDWRTSVMCFLPILGTSSVRGLPPEQFCRQGFVMGKASEAGFGNEMYKILTAAGLSIMLNRSLIIGKTRFKGTRDAVAAQFFLKNVHPEMRNSATDLFGDTEFLHSRPNELMRVVISPTADVEEAVNWTLNRGPDPHIALHMCMLMNRSVRAVAAALNCIKMTTTKIPHHVARPLVVLVSDTPSLVNDIIPKLQEFAEVVHFDYQKFKGHISGSVADHHVDFRAKDWGPAPRWVAFVDFFLASRASHAVITGTYKRVGTTYAQLIAAMAAAHQLDETQTGASNFSFISSFQSNLLHGGLQNQVGWGHVLNRYAGPLSCYNQPNQCALTPLLPPGWWDGLCQSPISRDIHRMKAYGVKITGLGTIDENYLQSFCKTWKEIVRTIPITWIDLFLIFNCWLKI